jgi:GAF domain-containing protein
MLEDLRRKGVNDLREYLLEHPDFVQQAIASVKILDVNEHSVQLFGAGDKSELLASLTSIFLPETVQTFQEELLVLDRGERFFQSETVLKRLDGRRLHVVFSISFPDEPSLSNPAMVSLTDITERKSEEERQQFLAEASAILSSSLDYETTLNNVARLVAGRLGDLCSIDLVDGGDVRRVAVAHTDPAKEALLAGMQPTYRPGSERHPVLRVTRSGRSELVNGVSDEILRDSARDAKHLEALRALNIASAMILPLSVGSRVLGAITIISGEAGRSYSEADLALAEELSRRAGMAIDNAELYRAREAAREAAQSAADRTTRLQAVTASLSEAVTPSEVADVVANAAISALEARSAFIVAMTEKGAFQVLASHGVNSDFVQAWSSYSATAPASIVQAIRLGNAVFASSREDLVTQFPALAGLPIADRSFAGVPLVVEGRAVGSMVLTFGVERVLDTEDREHVLALGRLCAQALERARLYDAAEDAREKAEAAGRQQRFLAEASAILASSLDHETTLASVARLCVPELADWCVIDVRNADGSFSRVAAVHRDPAKVAFARHMQERYPPDYAHGIVSQVVKTGESILYTEVPEEVLAQSARDEEHLAFVKELGVKSGIMVPLSGRGRTLGILTLLTAESQRRYGERELKLAEELGQRAGLALDNAGLYHAAEAARDVAEAARRRQAFLAEASSILTSSLDYQTTLAQVADLCVPELADWCAIDVSEEAGTVNHLAVVHRDPEKMALGRELRERYPTNYEGGIAREVFGSGKSYFWPELPEEVLVRAAQDDRHLDILRQLGLKSAVVVPLTAREKTVGMLTLVMAESGRRYAGEDYTLAQEVARRAAIAIDNARLYSAEQASRSQAEDAQQRLWFLAEANAVLSSSLDLETTLSRVAALSVPWLADCCVAHLFPAEGLEARAAISHVDQAKEVLVRELHSRYAPAPGEPHPIMQMIESQTPILLEDIEDSALAGVIHDERHGEILRQLGFKSYMAVPLVGRGRLFGALTFATSDPSRRYSRHDLSLAEELARRAALALDNARLYEDAQSTQDALRVALEAKDEFLGVMSHELRTPITAIYGGARVLRSRAERLDEESKSRLMEDIEQESERLFRMVENLLVLSRLELGQEVSTEPVLVQRLITKLTSSFKQRRPSRPVVVTAGDDLPPVAAEPHYLEQILRNLLSNADKYSPAERPIEVEAKAGDDRVAEISVLDRGAGIAPDEIDLIFDRFYRSDRTATQAAGIGLGLTVCKRLAEAQAGRIWARPREGGGLQVGITLPLCKEEIA